MDVPYIDDDQIYHSANKFLQIHHPTFSVPIPIEKIIEVDLGLSIFPIKNLESGCKIDGSLSKDFKTILIDEYVFEHSVQRARFTLAHEVGHYVLHQALFMQSGGFSDESGFIFFQNQLNEKDYKKLEIQAYRFAEEILFPKATLKQVIQNNIEELGGVDSLVVNDIATIVSSVVSKFEVSERAAMNKIRRDYQSLIEIVESNIPF